MKINTASYLDICAVMLVPIFWVVGISFAANMNFEFSAATHTRQEIYWWKSAFYEIPWGSVELFVVYLCLRLKTLNCAPVWRLLAAILLITAWFLWCISDSSSQFPGWYQANLLCMRYLILSLDAIFIVSCLTQMPQKYSHIGLRYGRYIGVFSAILLLRNSSLGVAAVTGLQMFAVTAYVISQQALKDEIRLKAIGLQFDKLGIAQVRNLQVDRNQVDTYRICKETLEQVCGTAVKYDENTFSPLKATSRISGWWAPQLVTLTISYVSDATTKISIRSSALSEFSLPKFCAPVENVNLLINQLKKNFFDGS